MRKAPRPPPPLNRLPGLAPLAARLPAETAVIDTSNYHPMRDSRMEAIEAGQVESQWGVERLGRPVAKAWNSIGSDSFATKAMAPGRPGRIALPVAADREAERKVAMALVEDTGVDAYLAASGEVESMTYLPKNRVRLKDMVWFAPNQPIPLTRIATCAYNDEKTDSQALQQACRA